MPFPAVLLAPDCPPPCSCAPAPAADKREYGLLGGAWDPQDGGHPEKDPAALTRTATRHFKAATGVDLSECMQVGGALGRRHRQPQHNAAGLLCML